MSVLGRIGANLDVMNNKVFVDAINQLSKHQQTTTNAVNQLKGQYGKNLDELTPELFSKLDDNTRAGIHELKNNPLNINNMNLGGQGNLSEAEKLLHRYDNVNNPASYGNSMKGASSPLPERAADTTATGGAEKGSMYDWMADKMKLTGPGKEKVNYDGLGLWDSTKATAKWFTTGSMGDKAKKIGLGAAAWGAGNVAMRGMTGGGVTYNNQGQQDVAGVPFV